MIYLVTIDVWSSESNVRGLCESVQGEIFKDLDDFRERLGYDRPYKKGSDIPIKFYTMSEFMDAYNNEEVNEANTFMTYVTLERPL